jgi:hypothetical protein
MGCPTHCQCWKRREQQCVSSQVCLYIYIYIYCTLLLRFMHMEYNSWIGLPLPNTETTERSQSTNLCVW